MTQLTDKHFAEIVPDKCHSPYVINSANGNRQGLFFKQDGIQSPPYVVLPPGSYRFLFTTATATEEDARKVVEEDKRGFKYYWNDKGFVPRGFNSRYKTALESLTSLLRSKNLDPDKNYTLIEKLSSDE